MGGKGGSSSGGSGTTTTTATNSPPPQVLDAYQNVVSQAQNVASQPLQQYTGPMVAGFTPAQLQSFQTVNNAQGVANPYINAAAQYAGQSATPITPTQFSADQVQQYMNPYTQNVVNATQAQFNNQNQQQAQQQQGQAIAQGAFGGDREAIAQAELANQQQLAQAPVIAGLNQSNYSQALGEFNTQQQTGVGAQEATGWLGSNAGYALGNLGNEAQNTALTGASAQLQSGALQQQLAQEDLNIPYEMFQQQQGYPFQTTNFLAGITEGVGGLEGGTASTTTPTASTASQAAGLGIAGLGALGGSGALSGLGFADGGRLRRADGGQSSPPSVPLGLFDQLGSLGGDSAGAAGAEGAAGADAGASGSALAGLGPVGLIAALIGIGKNTEYNHPDTAVGQGLLAGLGPSGSQIAADPEGMGLPTALGVPFLTPFTSSKKAQDTKPEWQGLFNLGFNEGGRVGRASGGSSSLPSIPDVSISYVPSAGSGGGGGHNTLPSAPKGPTDTAASPLSDLQGGMALGKLFKTSGNGSIANSPSNIPGVGSGASQFPYTGSDLASAESFDAAQNAGGIFSFGAGSSGALGDVSDLGAFADFANRGGRIPRDTGGAAASPMISGFTDAPGRPGISIPVLAGGPGGASPSGTGSGGTAGFAIPTAPIGTNIASTPAPAGQLDINPAFNWSPPDPNSLPHTAVGPASTAPAPTTPDSIAAAQAAAALQAQQQAAINAINAMNAGNHDSGGGGGAAGNGTGAGAGGSGQGTGGNSAGNDGSDGASDGGTGGNGGDGSANRGGVIRYRPHRDMGGNILASGAQTSGQPISGGNPLAAQQYQQMAQLPTEKLMELSQRVPPTTPQGAVIQRAIMQRKMNPQSAPQQQQAGFAQAPSPYGTFAGGQAQPQAQAQPQMARGGVAGFDAGGALGRNLFQGIEDGGDVNSGKAYLRANRDRLVFDPTGTTADDNERDDRHLPSDFEQRRALRGPGNQLLPPTPSMASGGRAGFADGGDPNDAPPPPTQVQSLSGMTNEDLVSAQDNPNYSPSLVGRELESRGIRSGWGNFVHGVGAGLSNIGSHFRDSATAGPPDAVTPEQAAAGAQTTANAARGVGDWFTKPIIPTAPEEAPASSRPFQRADAGSPSEVGTEDYSGKVLRRDDPRDDVKGGDQSPVGVGGFTPVAQPNGQVAAGLGPRDLHDEDPLAVPPPPPSKPTPPPPARVAGMTPVSSTGAPPAPGQAVPKPQLHRPTPPPPVETATPVPPSGGAVATPAAEQKTPGLQPARGKSDADNTSRNWSQSPWLALINAGAAMAAGNSPHWMQNAGAGIEAGTKTLGQQALFAQTDKFKQAEVDARNRGYDIESQKLADDLKYHRDSLAEEHDWHGKTSAHQVEADRIAQEKADAYADREHDYQQRIVEQGDRPSYVGPSTDPDHPGSVMIGRRPDGSIGTYIDPVQVGAKAGHPPATLQEVEFLKKSGIATSDRQAWDMARAGVKDKEGAARWVSQVQAEKNALRNSPSGGSMSEDELESRAQERIAQRYGNAPGAPAAAAAPQQFENGKTYKDSNGNKARYDNGNWIPVP